MALLDYTSFLTNESFLYESEMAPAEWEKGSGKYRTLFIEFLKDKNKSFKIYPKFASKYKFSSFTTSEITNLESLLTYISGGGKIDSKQPMLDIGGVNVPLTHLEKTGTFTTTGKTETDTDTKEGMVVYYYYNQNVDLSKDDLELAADLVNNIPAGDLFPSVAKKISQWILSYEDINMDQTSQWKSTANAMANFASAGYRLDRSNDILVKIRKKGLQLSNLSAADNWCPGDVYLYDPSARSEIINYVDNAQTIGELNLIFNDTFSPRSSNSNPLGSVIAVSLKQQAARLGKAKEYLTKLSPGDAKYNLTTDELEKCETDKAWARLEISSYQDKIQSIANSSAVTVVYKRSDVEKLKDKTLSSKLAAIKLAYHLLSLPKESADDLDSNLLSALKFGLKQSDPATNPPYYKIVGSIKGNANIEFVHGGDTLKLLIGGFDNKETKLAIVDSDTRLDILLFYYVSIGDIAYEIRLRAGGGGNKQAALEFEGKEPLGNIVNDPSGTIATINSYFSKRSS